MTIVGTRPEVIKISCVIRELDAYTDHVLVHSGQNYDYELNEVFFEDLNIRRPDHFLEVAADSVAETISAIISRSDAVLAQEQPDALLLYGDTNTCLAVIAAKRRKIPVFHMEAGNRCFDQRVPEELNRKVVDHLSDVNMVHSEHARRYLIAEGLRPELVIKTGSPMREVLAGVTSRIDGPAVLKRNNVSADSFFLVSCHREENVDSPDQLAGFVDTLAWLDRTYGLPILVSTHPRTRNRLLPLQSQLDLLHITWAKPFGYLDYLALQINARCVLSDSGTLTEEASILGFRAVMLREAHERPEGTDVGAVPFVGLRAGMLPHVLEMVLSQSPTTSRIADYEVLDVARTVSRVVLSYTDYINRIVWHRDVSRASWV
ncbi:MAG: non-hydrolyzing UDP-N-acetylglucosamine 2-epimerase [Candidatus Acidiferrales bacterium]